MNKLNELLEWLNEFDNAPIKPTYANMREKVWQLQSTPPQQTVSAWEIMTQVANEHSYETWGEMMYDTHEHSQVEYTKEAMEIYRNQPNPFTPKRTAKEEADTELNEAVSIIETLMQYGNIRPIEGVVYPAGTHKEFLHKANEWLHRNRSKVLTILKWM